MVDVNPLINFFAVNGWRAQWGCLLLSPKLTIPNPFPAFFGKGDEVASETENASRF
ncbi:hypothetical protein N836_32775 [Leptolyngbya sp. Heron Island J]|nr:hypothetical protein N836_32775 [Leptolyngbya sp. Heron Island J]